MLINVDFICKYTAGKLLTHPGALNIYSVSTDSRTASPGSVFFALQGEHFDGHKYVQAALDKGASAAVVSQPAKLSAGSDKAVILVEDTLTALQDLARGYRGLFNIPIVAVTGSVGKTTTRELIASCLQEKMPVLKTEGNFNNDIGLPLTLLKLETGHQAAVVEMGMRAAGEILRLANIARPTCAVITNAEPVHLETMGSVENIARAKCEILTHLDRDQFALINGDNPLLIETAGRYTCRQYTFGSGRNCDFRIKGLNINEGRMIMDVLLLGEHQQVEFNIPSERLALDVLGAVGAALLLGVDIDSIRSGLKKYSPVGRRLKITRLSEGGAIIDDTYNANPLSMAAALETAREVSGRGKMIAVLGDMFELGQNERKAHQWVGETAYKLQTDMLICIGNLAGEIAEGALRAGMPPKQVYYFEDRELGLKFLEEHFDHKNTWLFKASRGMKFETLIEAILNK